jgi:hypothetical protein
MAEEKGTPVARKSVKDLDVSTPVEDAVIDMNVTGGTAVAVSRPGASELQSFNDDFEGLDSIGSFMPYFVLDGTELLNKSSEMSYKDIEVVLSGGKKVWQLWDTQSNLIAESFDGINSTGGDNMNSLLMQTKAANPGEEDKIKIQTRYEVYFDWDYAEEGPKLTKISLSPSSMYAFKDYVSALKKDHSERTSDVITKISVKRVQNKQNQRYSLAEFEMVGKA